ncbi:MAG TPA: O-acetylhomoserine sulfhydrylase [Desulfobulbaceae bacterium]|nr:MAG: O-acetylhomoserine sulfhydrylase [Deltaproteobacteria bacterium RIFOXYD12_FULL_53_23]HCC53349.1 O-acetylhomoserine sulfhydrylase [Desulfobulbaceae bacterium]
MSSGFATRALHGTGPASEETFSPLRTPIHDTVAFGFDSAQSIADAFAGRIPRHSYSRISNPTVAEFEKRVQQLADSLGVVALSSGMAAIANLIMTLAGAGTNIVASRFLFGNTTSLLTHTLEPWGLETRFVDMTRPEQVAAAIDHNTRAVFLESITNPQLEVADLAAIAAISHAKGVPLILDNTAPTFYLCRGQDFGVDIEVVSSTKYISGGGTSVGGLIIDHGLFDWTKSPRLASRAAKFGPFALLATLRREANRNLGACLSPHAAYLQTLGLETMPLRIDRSCASTLALAEFLRNLPQVQSVNYPGLTDHPAHALAERQFGGRYGGILTFDLASQEDCFTFIDRLHLIRRATNINDNKSLALHPASTIFNEFTQAEQEILGIRPTMIRLSVGLEEIGDLQNDLEQALIS